MDALRRITVRSRDDERGVETTAMIIVLPMLCILIFALIDIGVMMRSRIAVENIARDTVRRVAADGGNKNPRINLGQAWDKQAAASLYREGKCLQGNCLPGKKPTIDCAYVTRVGTVTPVKSQVAYRAGDLMTCKVHYPYKALNKPLLDSGMGMGFGKLLGEFDVEATARAETGTTGL